MGERAATGAASGSSEEKSSPRLRRILAVGLEPELYTRVEALLNRSYFEVDRVPRGESGRDVCALIPFDLLIVRFPLPDMPVSNLVDALRGDGSPCARSHLLLLADPERLVEAQEFVGKGADAALATDRAGDLMTNLAARLLHVAPRVATRIMVHLQAQLGEGERQVFCQTADLSSSGMFVRTDESHPLATKMSFQLLLPEERDAVVGTAEVVRAAVGGGGAPEGIGLRFLDFRPGCEARLRAFLARRQGRP